MKSKALLLAVISPLLMSCSGKNYENSYFLFDTLVSVKYFSQQDVTQDVKQMLTKISNLSDNYREIEGVNNVTAINKTNEIVEIEPELYELLMEADEVNDEDTLNFNMFSGSLAKKWKESLENKQVLAQSVIDAEVEKIKNSYIDLLPNNKVQRFGEAEIDLGAIAKGYAVDIIHDYFIKNNIYNFIVDAGNSSIALGEKKTRSGNYTVGINDLPNAYLELKNCFVSTSSKSVQGVEIDGVTYSHIINPNTGSAINENDAVIVVSDYGYLGDAMSTSLMMNTVEEIKAIEKTVDIKTIVIKDKQIVYSNPDLKVKYR